MAFLGMLILVPGAMAFTVATTSIDPSIMNPGDPVNVTGTIYAASGTAFSAYDDLQFVTVLDDPTWSYTIVVNGVENTRPAELGKTLTVSGYELAYRNQDEVIVKIVLMGHVPASTATGSTIKILKIQELDAGSMVIPSSVYEAGHLVGQPTPHQPLHTGVLRSAPHLPALTYTSTTRSGASPR
jgi:hypothetical protein